MRREMYGIPDEACKEKEREVTFIGGAGINAPLFSGRSFHQRYLAPAGRVVRRQHIPAHLPRLFDALGQMEDRPPAASFSVIRSVSAFCRRISGG